MNAPGKLRVRKTDTAALYERFPHLQTIDLIWGSVDCRRHLFRLMTDTRGGTRRGFPAEHAGTVMRLLLEHDRLFPQFEDDGLDMRWGDEHLRPAGR
ncbi:MAG: hypothetical protein CVU25_03150 [Betaproteobacteria bacterium HGW-Betaproteobacteria-19]|nr:MAG: hypothetical protein CVU25_03150 [Betaproteobacteria bacterium HGW-Betaproteobacteria-19]